jgi:hypothetical protein
VHKVGHYPESHQDARSTKRKTIQTVAHKRFYVALTSPTTIERTYVVVRSTRHSCTILSTYGVWQIFIWPPISNFTKISSVGAALIHADRRTEMTKLIGAFHDYANAPKMSRAHSNGHLKLQYWLRTPLQPCHHHVWICESRRSHCGVAAEPRHLGCAGCVA